MVGNAVHNHEVTENGQDVLAPEVPGLDGQAFPGELIDDREHTELATIACPVLHEVIRPDMMAMLRPKPDAGAVIQP